MLSDTCPECGLPLFRLKSGEVMCPIHGRIFIARTEEEIAEASTLSVLTELEKVASSEISKITRVLQREGSEDTLSLLRVLTSWLDVIERVERIKTLLQHDEGKSKKSS